MSYLIEAQTIPVICQLIYLSVRIESSTFVSASVQFDDVSYFNVDNHVFSNAFL